MDDKSTWIPTWHTMSELMALDNWYDLWMRVKSLHNYMVQALGSCAKWPSDMGGNMI